MAQSLRQATPAHDYLENTYIALVSYTHQPLGHLSVDSMLDKSCMGSTEPTYRNENRLQHWQ